MAEIAVGAVTDLLIKALITSIRNQLRYVWSYRTYIKDLEEGLRNLKDIEQEVRDAVTGAADSGEVINAHVTRWLEEVELVTEKARVIILKDENLKKGCLFRGVIFNPFTRIRIAKRADEIKQMDDEFIKDRNKFVGVPYLYVPMAIEEGSYKGPENWIAPSRASLLVDISKALLDANVKIVGIWGASGVGKSILLKQLLKQVQQKQLNYDFDEVAMATVSRSPDWEKIQDDLAYWLGLKMKHNSSMADKAYRLRSRLSRNHNVLIILDDIWDKIDFEKLGIPLDDNHAKIKLLLTSTSEQVPRSILGSDHNFPLERLELSEAIELFEQILGDRAQKNATLINQLANECAGLPFLISHWATYLKSLPSILF